MHPRRAALILPLALAAAILSAIRADAACAAAPLRISLAGFDIPVGPRLAYVAEEGPDTTFVVQLAGGCDNFVTVDYATAPQTATSGSDYQHVSGTVAEHLPVEGSHSEHISVPIHSDGLDEGLVESLEARLSNPTATGGASPSLGISSAPILIVDSDGGARVGFEGLPYSQSETFGTARIPVFRAGPVGSSTTVSYAIAPDPAAPATPGQDYTAPASGAITFTGSDRLKWIDVGVINDKLGEGPENVILMLSDPSSGTIQNAQTTFTILDNEENESPSSKLHHPRHKWRYKKSDFRIREVHIFAHDNPGGSGVVGAQLALRRNLKSGSCVWLTDSGWEKKECSNRQWIDGEYDSVGELWRIRLKQLKSSVRTAIKDYTAFSRAIDGAGNVEKDFAEKRNSNTFEVKRSKPKR